MNFKQKGFTLVELVIVIAIIGILSAVALPRFANFNTEAKIAARQGVVASLNSAYAIVHSKYIASQISGAGTVPMDGGVNISVDATGYPDFAVYNSNAMCNTLIGGLLGNAGSLNATFGTPTSTPGCTVSPQTGSWLSPVALDSTGAK